MMVTVPKTRLASAEIWIRLASEHTVEEYPNK